MGDIGRHDQLTSWQSASLPELPWLAMILLRLVKFSASQVELRLALLSLNSPPTPPHPTRTSIFEPLLGYLGCWNQVWKLYSTNLGQLANQLAICQSPRISVASYFMAIFAISLQLQVGSYCCKKQSLSTQLIKHDQLLYQLASLPEMSWLAIIWLFGQHLCMQCWFIQSIKSNKLHG